MRSKYLVTVGEIVTAGKPAFLNISEGDGSAPVRWPAWESVFSVYRSKWPSGVPWGVQECTLPSTVCLCSASLLPGTQVWLCLKPMTSHSNDRTLVCGSPHVSSCVSLLSLYSFSLLSILRALQSWQLSEVFPGQNLRVPPLCLRGVCCL